MSRHISNVKLMQIEDAFNIASIVEQTISPEQRDEFLLMRKNAVEPTVQIAHGYDVPCQAYFCDLEPDCECGIYYGTIGLTQRMNKIQYLTAMKLLGLEEAFLAVSLDIPY